MNKQMKDPVIAAADRRQAEEIAQRVERATEGIPRHVMNGNHQDAVAFKKAAAKALELVKRKGNREKLHKMQQAWGLIGHYYQESKQ